MKRVKQFHIVGLVSLVMLGLMSFNSRGPGVKSYAPAIAQTCVPAPSGLVAWWPGDGNADDIVGGNHGTLMNGATFAPGLVREAFRLDGLDDVVEVPHAPSLSFSRTSPMTVDLWAFRTRSSPIMHLIGKRVACTRNASINYQLFFNELSGEGLGFGAGFGNEVATGMNLPLNTWTHLAGTFDGTTYRFYINGQLAGTAAGFLLGLRNTAPVKLGGAGDCATFAGFIDEVEIFDRALTDAEVLAIFNAGSAGKCKE
jgi:hypothetical protein